MNLRYPLRFTVPLAILATGAIIILSAWLIESRAQRQGVLELAEQQLRSSASFVAAELEAAFRNQDYSEVRAAVERAAANPVVRSIRLVDTEGEVAFSSEPETVGRPLNPADGFRELTRIASAPGQAGQVQIHVDPEQGRVMGRFPIHMRSSPAELMPTRAGALFLVYDLSRELATHRADLAGRMIGHSLILMALALGFWLLLRSMLLLRIDRLIHAVREVGKGNFDVGTEIGGHDELAELGRELDSMAKSLRDHAEHLAYLADHDALTGLLNRIGIEAAIEVALAETRTRNAHFALCLVDIDSLRVINDTQGHLAGDELLRSFANLLEDALPDALAIARVGGDEFAALIDLDHRATLSDIGQRLAEKVQSFRFERRGERFGIQATTGIIGLGPELKDSGEALGAADAACYRAKETQRGSVHIGRAETMREELLEGSMRWVSRIHEALDEDRFALYAQRILPITDDPGDRLHFEILVRMVDRDGTIQPPGKFLEASERYNLVGRIDRWVLSNALAWLDAQGERLERISTCSINLSGASLGDPGMLEEIRGWLKQHPAVDPALLCLEVTETAAIRNLEQALRFITELRKIGCRFALDDFGTGLSSFEYLKQLPVDLVKIDGIFVRDIVNDPVDRAIVKAIHDIATQAGMRTIAEFVESTDIMLELASIGVDYGQGYGIAKPAPIDEIFEPLTSPAASTTGATRHAD